ncbi:MAG TPA: hypothetical protein VMU50_03855, partial [Polyangia bacterium]|nr:hypothetical protein [Polyangia bacterium]
MRTDGSAPALRCWLARVVDLRRGDGRGLARSAAALTLIVAAHAVLETARDALLLSQFPARNLAAVYPAVALSVIPAAALVARWSARFGVRAALVAGLALAATALAALFIAGAGPGTAMGAYVLSGLVSGVLIPLYWNLCASALTPMQARRLLGVVAAAGTVGAVGGAAAALAALRVVPVPGLLLLSAAIAALAIPVLPRPATDPSTTTVAGEDVAGTGAETSPFSDPFVGRVALLVAASTAAFVVLDFFFKWTVVRTVGPARVPSFVARFYLLTSVAALVAQLVGSRALVRRLGVAWTMLVTPVLTVAGAGIAALLGGMAPAAMVLKALDGTMRGSVYRTSLELAYLPLPPATRARAKPLIDGALARVVQTIVGAGLLAGGVAGRLSATSLAFATLGLATLWLVAARALQKPYLGLLRRAIGGGALTASGRADPLDLQSAEALIAYLSHQDDFVVVGAMNALARRGRAGLISALILLRDEEAVLARALGIFAASDRQDWIARARLLLADPRDAVAMAAARALAAHHALDAADLARDQRPRLHGYAALFVADARLESDPASSPDIAAILERAGREGEQQRLGLLAAIADAPASQRLRGLLDVLAARADFAALPTTEWARAVAQQRAEALIATLISRLQRRDGRGPVRAALLSFGAAALDPLARALRDPAAPRALRVHVPNTLARFATRP